METQVEADAGTQDSWQDYKTNSTQYTGRIWTDKSVYKENVTLTDLEGSQTQTIEKPDTSDFLVSLSALSSASTLVTTTTTPLDIVLVLDVSGSMSDEMTETRITYEEYRTSGNRANNVGDAWQDRGDLYYSANGQDYIKINMSQEGFIRTRYTISAEGLPTIDNLTGNDDIPAPYADHLYIRNIEEVGTGEKKITALKNAVNNFIQLTSDANANMPEGEGHRVSIIKFADDSFYKNRRGQTQKDHVGNDYNNSRYNYTQVMRDFTEVKSNNVNEVQGTINSINPAGATSADYGLELANDVFNGTGDLAGARENAKKAVIFFTDGEPNHQSGFDEDVANDAIVNSGLLKNNDTLIYSIGVFGDANPDDTTNEFNAYMNGVSSNYPNAQSYTNLGTRAPDASYYKAASNASDLSQVFTDIFDSITQGSGGPTQVEETEGAQDTDGYITFTDKLGDYMQVDDVNAIVYGGKKFTKTSASNETDYYFEGSIEDNPVYDSTNLSNIKIHVTKGQDGVGDTITVQIPASLIPLRYFDIDEENNMSVEEAYPIRLFYSASLKDEVEDSLLNGTADETLKTYINAHKSDDGKQAYFYSNQFNSGSNGTTIADFTPARSNKFYYFTEPTLLYTDKNCENPATNFVEGGTYYYKNEYYISQNGKAVQDVENVSVSGLLRNQIEYRDGQIYVIAGTRKLSRADQFVGAKNGNITGTATNVISPSWGQGQQDPNKVYVALGNNGRVALNLPGTLKVSKIVETNEGITAPDDTFEFTLTLEGEGSNASYYATIFDAEGNPVEGFNGADQDNPYTIKSDNKFTLKDGQYIEVYGLPDGIKYSVVETSNTDYTTTNDSAEGATNAAEGTVAANETVSVDYTNKFEVKDLTIDDTSSLFTAAKKLIGRDWTEDDTFTFRLGEAASQNTIQNAQEENNRKYVTVTLSGQGNKYTDGQEISFKFGQLKYTKPGQYTYYVSEVVPNDRLPGMTYSNATYKVDVTVIQDEKDPSTLKVDENTIEITQLSNDEGSTTNDPVENILIENKFSADSIESAPVAFKNYDPNNTGYNLVNGMFSFTLKGLDGAPMPKDATGDSITTFNDGQDVNFDLITFDSSMVGHTYTYTITENIPSEANETNGYTVNGMTYDPKVYYVDIEIQAEETAQVSTVKPIYTYYTDPNNKAGSIVENENVVFNNEYNVTPYTIDDTNTPIQGVKKLIGRDMLEGEAYTFDLALSKVNGNTNTQNSGVTISNPTATVTGGLDDQETLFSFDSVTFTKAGTYEFTISESSGNAGGVTYDTVGKTVTVVITDQDKNGNHTGQLALGSISYNNNGVSEVTDKAYFVNKYTSSGVLEGTKINVKKVLNGRDWIDSDSFTFTIAGYDDVTKQAIEDNIINLPNDLTLTTNNKSGTFGNITFNKAGEYQFIITENTPTEDAAPNVTYSKAEYIVKVKAVDNNDGTITIADSDVILTQSILDDGSSNESGKDVGLAEATFTNTYTPDSITFTPIDVTKVLEGRDPGLQAGEFSFELSVSGDADGYQLPSKTIVENDADGNVEFGDITFTKPGKYYVYVREQKPQNPSKFITYDSHRYVAVINVQDNPETGKLEISDEIQEYGSKEFKNTYKEKEQSKTVSKDDQSIEDQMIGVGDELTYTINWVNTAMDEQTGQSVKAEVTVTDVIPEGTEFVTASDGYSYDESSKTVTWNLGQQEAEAEGSLTLTVRVTEDAIKTNEVTNTATVNIGDNKVDTNTVTNYVPGKTVTGYDGDVKVGDTLTYEISYVNPYNEPAEIVITDTLMDGLTYVENSANPSDGFEVDGQNLAWSFNVGANEKGKVSFKAIVNEDAFKVDSVSNTATIKIGDDPEVNTNTPGLETKEGSLLVSKEIQLTEDQGTTIDTNKEFEFTLSLSGQDNQPLSGEYEFVKSDNTTGTIKNDDTFTLKHGENLVINGLPEGTKYSVTESKAEGYVASNETLNGTISEAKQSEASFVNTYGTSAVTGVPQGFELTKVFTGHEWTSDYAFEFKLEAGTNDAGVTTPMPDETTKTVSAPDQGSKDTATFDFGAITYTKVGTYNYTVSEVTGDNDGITYSDNVAEITVNVTDNKDGTLSAKATLKEGTGVFTNTYSAKGTTSIEVTKDLKGRNNDEWIDGDAFTFTLASTQDYGADVVMPQSTTLTIDKDTVDHKASFGDITFNKAGDYEFKVTEVNDSKANVTYSTEEYTVSVHVEDENGNGSFTVTPTIRNKAGEKVESIVFENTYTPSSVVLTGENAIHGTKTLTGRNSKENETFNFALTEDENNDKSGYTIAENGNVASVGSLTDGQASGFNFGDITFTKRGTYTFYVSEVLPEGANESNGYTLEGVTYDNHKETVTVTVTDDYMNNTLVPTVTYDADGVTFINKYDASDFVGIPTHFTLTKVFEGKTWTTEDVFEFTLTAGENTAGIETPMPDNPTVQVNAPTEKDGKTANFDFGSISYDTVGEYHYTVSETEGTNAGIDYSKNVAEITVTVTDNKQGGLVASAKVENGRFTNTYSSELDYVGKGGIKLIKNLTGHDLTDDQFTFTLNAEDEASRVKAGMENMSQDVFNTDDTMDANGLSTSTIQLLPNMDKFTQDDVGKVYKYTISETSEQKPGYTNDTTEYTIQISTSDDGSGTLTVSTRITGTNGTDITYEYTQSKQKAETGVAQVVFNNTYTSSTNTEGYDASVNLTGTKTLTNRPMVDGEFQFNVLSNGSVVSSGTNTADGTVAFTPINYTNDQLIQDHANGIASKDGNTYTYVYDVEEVTPGNGVSIVAGKFSVTVKVTDNGDGKLTTKVIYPEGGLAFENAYGQSASAELKINGKKSLAENGTNHPDITDKFEFTITGREGAPMPEKTTVRNDAAGNVDFGKIVYTMQNVFGDDGQQAIVEQETPVTEEQTTTEDGSVSEETEEVVGLTEQVETYSEKRQKTFTYEINESGSVPGVTNDTSKIITVTVTDNGDGTISVTSDTNGTFEFVNTYVPEKTDETSPTDSAVTIKKVLDGRTLKADEFSFTMMDENGNGVQATNAEDGSVVFPKLTFDKEGIYTYTISETNDNKGGVTYDTTTYKAIATVTDDTSGKLKVEWKVTDAQGKEINEITFNNKYTVQPTSLTLGATKVLEGRELADKEFLFVLSDEEGNVVEEAYNDKTGKVTFSDLTFDKAGTYNYTVTEKNTNAKGITYDESVYNIQVEVVDNEDGTLNMTTTTTKDGEVSSIVFRNKAEKDSVPEQPEKGDTSNTSTRTFAGLFTSLAVDAAALAGIATLLKKRNAKK
ncbi:Spy0128 family protein [Faecalitalea cylindroides]|uniref:Pilin isopeptide linkage domain protein n=1 Tax=Faecalitalea cylindroides ATCC 27803 TaxID=649755 RepID=U2PFQ3_9FIRM|nr:FctA domain-containing protein [Faecalitalea cylindroides]ERK42971.1 pilin isopeptide linkage domain protein [[Eubacterium] cylindroides ATCC 27803] [Faecalitalea cylindroides ATCC 27803]